MPMVQCGSVEADSNFRSISIAISVDVVKFVFVDVKFVFVCCPQVKSPNNPNMSIYDEMLSVVPGADGKPMLVSVNVHWSIVTTCESFKSRIESCCFVYGRIHWNLRQWTLQNKDNLSTKDTA